MVGYHAHFVANFVPV